MMNKKEKDELRVFEEEVITVEHPFSPNWYKPTFRVLGPLYTLSSEITMIMGIGDPQIHHHVLDMSCDDNRAQSKLHHHHLRFLLNVGS